MNANDIVLWLVVAAVAFLVGQGRLRGAQPLLDPVSQDTLDAWRHSDGSIIRVYRRGLHARLERRYNIDELHALAFDMGLQPEQIGGDGATLSEYIIDLISYCERRGCLPSLLEMMR